MSMYIPALYSAVCHFSREGEHIHEPVWNVVIDVCHIPGVQDFHHSVGVQIASKNISGTLKNRW